MASFVYGRYLANVNDVGTIKMLCDDDNDLAVPAICLKRWQNYEWIPLRELSAGLWMQHRNTISHLYMPPDAPEEKETNIDDTLVNSLLKILSKEQRKEWIKTNPEYKEKVCTECGCFNPTKKKCIHHDCPGMCEVCFNKKNKKGFTTCGCCGKKQEMTCPCCQEDFSSEDMVKSENCEHRICWSCFGRSIKTSRPLSHCPMCRDIFCEKLHDKQDQDTDDEMPDLISDDEQDDYYREGDQWEFEMSDDPYTLSDENFASLISRIINIDNGALAQAILDGNVRVNRGSENNGIIV